MRIHRVRESERERKRTSLTSNIASSCRRIFRADFPLSLSLPHLACKSNGRRRISKMNPPKAVPRGREKSSGRGSRWDRRLQRKLSFLVQEARILAASSAVVQVEPTATLPLYTPVPPLYLDNLLPLSPLQFMLG